MSRCRAHSRSALAELISPSIRFISFPIAGPEILFCNYDLKGPFSIALAKNRAEGLRIRLGAWRGVLPGTILYCYFGHRDDTFLTRIRSMAANKRRGSSPGNADSTRALGHPIAGGLPGRGSRLRGAGINRESLA